MQFNLNQFLDIHNTFVKNLVNNNITHTWKNNRVDTKYDIKYLLKIILGNKNDQLLYMM